MKKAIDKFYTLNAASLVETLVASVISAITFAVGLMIYTNVLTSNYNSMQSKLSLFIDAQIEQNIKEQNYKSETIFFDNIQIEKKISIYRNNDEVIELTFEATNSKGNIVYEKSILKYVEN